MASEYAEERMTPEEKALVKAFPHQLSDADRKERSGIINREVKRDLFWGFFDYGRWASFKRTIYRVFIHPFLRK